MIMSESFPYGPDTKVKGLGPREVRIITPEEAFGFAYPYFLFQVSFDQVGISSEFQTSPLVVGFEDDGHTADGENEDSPKGKGKRRSALFLKPGGDTGDLPVSMAIVHGYPLAPRSGANTPTRRPDNHDMRS